MAMEVVECVGREAFLAVWPVMRQLRDTLSEEGFLARLNAAQGEGKSRLSHDAVRRDPAWRKCCTGIVALTWTMWGKG